MPLNFALNSCTFEQLMLESVVYKGKKKKRNHEEMMLLEVLKEAWEKLEGGKCDRNTI